jgi:hypothetical protein
MTVPSDILDRIIAASQHLPPPPKEFAIIASRLKDNRGQSIYDRYKEMLDQEMISIALCPVDFKITKTVDKAKSWKRLNRPAKVKVVKKKVPAIILMDLEFLKMPPTPEFKWTTSPPKFEHNFGVRYGYRYL